MHPNVTPGAPRAAAALRCCPERPYAGLGLRCTTPNFTQDGTFPVANSTSKQTEPEVDSQLTRIVSEEESCLKRVVEHIRAKPAVARKFIDYDGQLIDLRDQIAQSRMEDVPPLLEQMERLQYLAARQGQSTVGHVDLRSPYFGRLVLREAEREREVLIGRSTYIDTKVGVRIVDWRDAPVSRLFYRYTEGDDYEETFGEREVEGEVVVRRSLTIVDAALRRITAPQGVFVRPEAGAWQRGGPGLKLAGGQGSALRAANHGRPGKLGVGAADPITGEDRHLRAITALIDPRQFELITKPDSGLVVIQGGAGSGKTTIGLHRLAYLAFQDKRRFRPDRMLVIAFNQALTRYISQVLPALDVAGVGVRTYTDWAARLRQSHFPELTTQQVEDTPNVVTRLKKHPAMLKAIEAHVETIAASVEAGIAPILRSLPAAEEGPDVAAGFVSRFRSGRGRPLTHRLNQMRSWLRQQPVPPEARNAVERHLRRGLAQAADVVGAWSELITDLPRLRQLFDAHAPGEFDERQLSQAHEWCSGRSALVILHLERNTDRMPGDARRDRETAEQDPASPLDTFNQAEAPDEAQLDAEDDALLLRFYQLMRGPLLRPNGQDALTYEHILVDEAQDLSPVELAVVAQTLSGGKSMTLAGDVAQRLYMDNGFTGWDKLLSELSLSHVEVEPLRVSYRSTHEVMEFAQAVLGPLVTETPHATRRGAPVELFRFAHSGDAVGFLAEALRELVADEPQASIAVISRYPEQADLYYAGLRQAETSNLRRIAEQDFPFRPGVDVTDVRQVKGLEFDYVILVEVNHSTYGLEDEARHLLHIAATRAAHQLWLLTSAAPSGLLPQSLRDHSY